ncbi:hypothetical protein NE865_01212 [Phthorimaea operculella]|nr:hypothetical protein NE865_01212 [Phthorimaea operculella]
MNVVYEKPCLPLRLLIVDPLSETGTMLCLKALSGFMFGDHQMVEVILLVYANEEKQAERLKWELDSAGLRCNNGVTVTSALPSISDADVFIFLSNFPSLNSLDFSKVDEPAVFDSLYLILKVANNLEIPIPPPADGMPVLEPKTKVRKTKPPYFKPHKPIILADGLVTLDIVKSFSKNLPDDIFFCPSPLTSIAKTVLAEKLGVLTYKLNDLHVWAADDKNFHVDVLPPLYTNEASPEREHCEWNQMAKKEYEVFEMDFTNINETWLKKDFILKLRTLIKNHPIGSIYKSTKIDRVVKHIWRTRSLNPPPSHKFSFGVISDGSLETHKGLPYVLPIIFEGDSYKVNDFRKDDYHLKQEIQRMNKAVLEHHRKLVSYCKMFLEKNVINMEFLPKDSESGSHGDGEGFTIASIESSK